jgi:hypothetical protein
MNEEVLLPKLVFLVGFVTLGVFWLRKQLQFRAAIDKLEEQFRKEGKSYDFLHDVETRMKFLQRDYSVEDTKDSTAIHDLKLQAVERHREIVRSLKFLIIGAVIIFLLTIMAGLLEFAIRR